MKKLVLALVIIAVAVVGYLYGAGKSGTAWLPGASPTPVADDMVRIDAPLPGAKVSSPLTVMGSARGSWYFEASFPVILKDASGAVIAQKPAQAQGDWMTTDFVPFTVTLSFPAQPAGSHGTLILRKDNPSGLAQYDDSRQITVSF